LRGGARECQGVSKPIKNNQQPARASTIPRKSASVENADPALFNTVGMYSMYPNKVFFLK
jgi:hypothetical protein